MKLLLARCYTTKNNHGKPRTGFLLLSIRFVNLQIVVRVISKYRCQHVVSSEFLGD